MYATGRRSQCKKRRVHRGRALGELRGTSWTCWGVHGFLPIVATRKLPLLRGGGLPERVLAPGTPPLTPCVPFLLNPFVNPSSPPCPLACHHPCHPPPPYRHPRLLCHPRRPHHSPPRPPEVGLCLLPGGGRGGPPAPGRCPPPLSVFLVFPFFTFFPYPPPPLGPHPPLFVGSSSSQSPNTVVWLTVPPLPPSPQGTYWVSPTRGIFS